MYKKIMAPLDGSELAECVLPHVQNFMGGFPDCRFIFIRVVEPLPISLQGESYTRKDINLLELESEKKAEALEYLEGVAKRIAIDGAPCEFEALSGRVAESLADYAKKNEIDLILIATHGRSGVGRWVRGSVADKVLRSSNVPVLMVRAPGTRGGI